MRQCQVWEIHGIWKNVPFKTQKFTFLATCVESLSCKRMTLQIIGYGWSVVSQSVTESTAVVMILFGHRILILVPPNVDVL